MSGYMLPCSILCHLAGISSWRLSWMQRRKHSGSPEAWDQSSAYKQPSRRVEGSKDSRELGGGATRLFSQHSEGRERQITVSSKPARSTESIPGQIAKLQKNPLEKQTNKQKEFLLLFQKTRVQFPIPKCGKSQLTVMPISGFRHPVRAPVRAIHRWYTRTDKYILKFFSKSSKILLWLCSNNSVCTE